MISISDPVLAEFFGVGPRNFAGVNIGEQTALGLSAVYRAVSIISGTIAGLPLRTFRETSDGTRIRTPSFLDDPAGPDSLTKYEWVETVLLHLLLHGNAFLIHRFNNGGGLAGLFPIHPLAVRVDFFPGVSESKTFHVTLDDGTTRTFTPDGLTHIPALSLDGIRGLSPISIARNSLGTAIAGDRAAAKMFSNGALLSGLVTPEDDMTVEEAEQAMESIRANVQGHENAGEVVLINRKLKFTPWTMSAEDAQFLESRQFQIEEVARWYGIAPHLLHQTEKQTSWGTGVAEQNRGLARFTLRPWTARIEQRLSRLLPSPRFAEFDFAGLEKPTPEQEIALLIQQVGAGLITVNEARRIRGMDPITGGDALRIPGETLTSEPEALNGGEADAVRE